MAGKGGGSWKVAYADFVTAMMAFFLVMWLSAQDQSVKQAVANYFSRAEPFGFSKKPGKSASVFAAENSGDTPLGESVAMGRGRSSYAPPQESSSATKLLSDWIHGDEQTYQRWKEQARRQRATVSLSADTPEDAHSAQKMAVRNLATQLKNEFTLGMPPRLSSLYQDLLMETLAEVNWVQLAEDILDNG